MAFGCTAPTSAFGLVVRKAYRSSVVSPSLTFRTLCQPSTRMVERAELCGDGLRLDGMTKDSTSIRSTQQCAARSTVMRPKALSHAAHTCSVVSQ